MFNRKYIFKGSNFHCYVREITEIPIQDGGLIKFLGGNDSNFTPQLVYLCYLQNRKSESRPKRAMHFKAKIQHQKKQDEPRKKEKTPTGSLIGILIIVYYNSYRYIAG